MKGFMKRLEEIMVIAALAEEGVSALFRHQRNNLARELGEQAWDLR